jgi:TP901 family phage tail tape measure protein
VKQEDILQFTRVMIDLGETTDLTADQAATSIAQLMNMMQSAGGDVDNLGATLVHLGNTGASTEAEILELAQRIAGAGHLIGLSEDEVLGFAAAMADVGINAELGGTAMQRVFLKMFNAVKSGGSALTEFAEVAGVSAQEFATIFENEPARAVQLFFEGLQRIDGAGGNVITTMQGLGLNGQLVQQVILRLMGAGDQLNGTLDRSATAWGENTALTDEAGKRYATTAAQFEMVRNKIVDLFIDMGRMMLPFITVVVDAAGTLAEAFQDLPAPIQFAVGALAGLVAAGGPLIFVAGHLVKNFVVLRSALSVLSGPAMGAAKALGLIGVAALAGVAIYQMFTAEQRKTKENTERASAALDGQFSSLMNAAIAAAEASGEIDAVAVANAALSAAIAEGNQQLADSAAILNVSADRIIDYFSGFTDAGEPTLTLLDNLARSFGLNAEQADFFARSYGMAVSPVQSLSDGVREQAEALGIGAEEWDVLTDATRRFLDAADETTIQQVTRDFLNARVEAGGYSAELVAAAEAQTGLNRNVDDATAVYQAYAQLVATATDEQRQALGITDEVAASMVEVDALLGDAGEGFEELADSGMAAADALAAVDEGVNANFMQRLRELAGLNDREGWLTALGVAEIERFGEALHKVLDPQQHFVRSQDAIWKAGLTFTDSIDKNSRSLEQNSEEGLTNRGVLMDWMDQIVAGADAQIAAGDSIRDVTNTLEFNKQALVDAAVAAGFNREEVEDLVEEYGLVPESVTTAIHVSGQMVAISLIEDLLTEIDTIPDEVVTQMQVIAQTDGAWAAYHFLRDYVNSHSATLTLNANTAPIWNAINAIRGATILLNLARGFAEGGFVNRPTPGVFGEAGPEVVLPLSRPGRLVDLLGDPRVAGPISAAMGGGSWMPMHGWAGGSSSSVTSITVNMPPGSDGDDVVRALKKYERRRGPVPISTR